MDKEALEHLDECLKEYPPSTDKKVQAARAKFFDLRVEIRDRCRRMACDYKEPPVSSGLEAAPIAATAAVAPTQPAEASKPAETKAEPTPAEPAPEAHHKSPKWPVVITTGALGVVGLGLGVGFHFVSQDAGDSASNLKEDLIDDDVACELRQAPECAEYASKRQDYYDFRTASTVGLIAGGVLVTSAVVMAIVWPDSARPGAAMMRPTVAAGPDGYFLGLHGRF